MTRLMLTTALCVLLPATAFAEDIVLRADIARATIFGSGADVTRAASLTIPEGRHRILIAMPDLDAAQVPRIVAPEGLSFGPPQPIVAHPIAEGALDDPAQARARAALEAAEAAMIAAQDALAEADAGLRAIDAQQGYIAAILRGGENGVAMPEDPAQVPQFLAMLGAQSARLAAEAQAAQVARRDLVEAAAQAQEAHAEAARALALLAPFGPQVNVLAIDVTAGAATEALLELEYFTPAAGWVPSYELDLDSETGALEVDRFVTLRTYGGARWNGVTVTFSTSDPYRPREPSALWSTPARIVDPVELGRVYGEARGQGAFADAVPAPVPAPLALQGAQAEPALVVEARIEAVFGGLSVSYPYPDPVSVGATGEVLLAFDRLSFETEMENRAVPRWDETAFLVATLENDSGAPILPGEARFYRDGALMGEGFVPLVAAGAEAELAFGALDHLRLTWIDRALAEGDRGVFTTSTTQVREVAFGIENTGTEAETVRLLHAAPFAEQEDLELRLSFDRQPDAGDVEDLRGVQEWILEVAPGAEELIEMRAEFAFPEGRILDWQP